MALFATIFSMPRSSRRDRIISCISSALNSGCEQNVHGPMPSFIHTIFPQLRQLGAAARSGWRVARQSQRREAGFVVDREGLVWSSSVRMAESRSARVVDGACIEGPPDRFTLVFGAGEAVLEEGRERVLVWTLGRSDIKGPDAEGGGFVAFVVEGRWRTSGFSDRARVFVRGSSLYE